ncbi:MAG TPA: tetratricopeptide repeat protein [Terriglobales bacterium]|nr:tetratricopeptide repeat protein [Terriglobales bacterium]
MDRALRLERQGRPEKALLLYQAQLQKTPGSDRAALAELQFRIGETFLAMDRAREAFSAFNRAIELDSDHRAARLRLGEMYLLTGSPDRAAEQAEAVLHHNGENLDALALLGAAASARGDTEAARNAYEDVLEKDPGRIKVALSLADLLNRNGETATARFVLLRAAKAQPKSPEPWMTLGRLEESVGRAQQAEEDYRKAASIEDAPETNLRLAQFLERTARLAEARTVLQHVDALRPKFQVSKGDLAFVSGSPLKAQSSYLAALNSPANPHSSFDRDLRSRMISRLIESDLADAAESAEAHSADRVALARKHLDIFRNDIDPAAREVLEAETAIASDDFSAARSHVDAALHLAPDSATAEYVNGELLSRLGDDAAAESAWNRASDNDSSHIPTRLALAKLALRRNDLEEAESDIIPVIREEPANLAGLMIFGRVLIAQHNLAAASVIANRASAAAPQSPLPDLLLGEIQLARKDSAAALICFQKAILQDPNSTEAVEGLIHAYDGGNIRRGMLLAMEKVANQQPKSAPLLEISGRLFAQHGWNRDAERSLESALQVDPSRSTAAVQLARVLVASGNERAASRYALLVPGISEILQGSAAEQRGDLAAAIAHYEAAVRAGDRTSTAANNLAWIYAQGGRDLNRAVELAQRAVELAPTDPGVLDTLGFVRLRRREYSDSVRVLQQALGIARETHAPELPVIEQHLRAAYLHSGQPELAAALHQPGKLAQ